MVTEIYSYGALEIYRDVFNAIAMLSNDKSFIKMLLTIGTVIGSFWAIIIMMFGDFVKPFTNWILPVAVIQTLLFMPGKQVYIIDVVQRKHAAVDNVPYGLAVVAGTVSKFSHMITQKVEAIFSLPDDLKYSQSGGVFGANLMEKMKVFSIYDENFAENMRQFVGQCVVYDLALGRKYTIQDMRNTHDMWGLVSRNASEARSFLWKDPYVPAEIITCAEGVVKFNQQWQRQISETACKAGSLLFGSDDWRRLPVEGTSSTVQTGEPFCRVPFAKEQIVKHLPLHFAQFVGASQSAQKIMQQQMMISAFVDGQEYASRMVGNAPNYAVRKAYLQQNLNNNTIAKLAAHTLPMLRTSLELLCYSLFIFLIPIIAFPMGYRVLVSWSQVVLWLSMWPPVYAVLNMIMMSAQSMKTVPFAQSFNPEGISLVSSLGIQNISADISSQAGYLSTLVPFICIAIVKGISQFMHLSSSLMATGQSAAASASSEELSGNYNTGNVSLDNHSLGNTSMLHQNYNASMSSGNFTQQLGHSSITTDTQGDSIAHIEQSQLPLSMNMAQNMAHSTHQAAAKELSQGHSIMQSVEKSLGSTIENMGTFGKTLSESTNIQEGFTESQQREVGHAMSQVQRAVDHLSKDTGLTKDKTSRLLASIGSPKLAETFFGISGNSENVASSFSSDQIKKAKDISQEYSFDDNLKISAQGMQSLAKHQNSDEVQSFVNNHQSSVAETARQSESAQKHFDESQRLSSEARYMEDNSVTMNRNLNDKFVDWLAHQPPAFRHEGHMGERAALMMISRDPELAQSYAENFQRQQMASMGYGSSSLPTEKDLKQSYDSHALGDVVQKDAVSNLAKEANSLRGHNLHSKAEGMEDRITEGYSQAQQFMDQSKHDVLDEGRQDMNREFNSRSNNVGVFEVMGDVVDTAVQTVARPAVKTLEWTGMMDMSGNSEPKMDYTKQFKEMGSTPSLKNVSEIQSGDSSISFIEGKDLSYSPSRDISSKEPASSFGSMKNEIVRATSSQMKMDTGMKHEFEDHAIKDQVLENVVPYAPRETRESDLDAAFQMKDISSNQFHDFINNADLERKEEPLRDIQHHRGQEDSEHHKVIPYSSLDSLSKDHGEPREFIREENITESRSAINASQGNKDAFEDQGKTNHSVENVVPYAPKERMGSNLQHRIDESAIGEVKEKSYASSNDSQKRDIPLSHSNDAIESDPSRRVDSRDISFSSPSVELKDSSVSFDNQRERRIGEDQIHSIQGIYHEHDTYSIPDQALENVVPYASKERMESDPGYHMDERSLEPLKDQTSSSHLIHHDQSQVTMPVSSSDSISTEHHDQAIEQPRQRAKVVVMKQESQNVIEDLNQPSTLKKEQK